MHHIDDLITIFNRCFLTSHQTQLVKGGDEPLYHPKSDAHPYHSIVFAHGFYSSALHECAHWLIAGKERRQLVDYGYWYCPDGRDEKQQSAFEQVEVKPQALEWLLSAACQHKFRISNDNLTGAPTDNTAFKKAVHQQVITYCDKGINPRAETLRLALCQFYKTPSRLDASNFLLDML